MLSGCVCAMDADLNTNPSATRCQADCRKIGRMSVATTATITPATRVRGRLTVPGDKSISHRYALLAALAEGHSELSNYAPGADCQSTLTCLRGLGVEIARSGNTITIEGRGLR